MTRALRGAFSMVCLALACQKPSERPCPTSAASELLSQPIEIEFTAHDLLDHPNPCGKAAPKILQFTVDQKPYCKVELPCTETMVAPPPSFVCTGPALQPGEHALRVEIEGRPSSVMLRTATIPAFRVHPGGSLSTGAHIGVWVDDERIMIDPPTATPTLGL